MNEKQREILRDVAFGLAVAIALILIKEWIDEKTDAGRQLELATYVWLQHRLEAREKDAQLPIVILDLSELKQRKIRGAQKNEEATPRDALEKLLNTLIVNEGAYAVGVDVDFSPIQDGRLPVTPQDHRFFDACLKLEKKYQKKIYLGVYRTVLLPREKWLGPEQYKDLGASILAPRFEVSKMVNCVAVKGVRECEAETMGALMAQELRNLTEANEKHLADRVPRLVERVSERQISPAISVGMFPVDYSQLKALMSREHTFYSMDARVLAASRDFFRDKIVLVGDADPETASDRFVLPGSEALIPGVYVHASAAYTLAQAPLYELSGLGRWVVDLILALAVIAPIALIRWYYSGREGVEVAHHRLEGWLVVLVVAVAIIVSVGVMHVHRVLWTDFVLAIFALLLHPKTEHYTNEAGKWLRKALPKAWNSAVFEKGEHK